MSNEHMKRYSASLVISEMQIKTMRYHFTPTVMARIKKEQKKNKKETMSWQGCGETGTFVHCWGGL